MGITCSCLDKNVPFDGPFRRIFSDAPRYEVTGGNALRSLDRSQGLYFRKGAMSTDRRRVS